MNAAVLENSPRETEIVALLLTGCDNREIASSLGIDERTVKNRLRILYQRYAITSGRKRVGLIALFFESVLATDDERMFLPSELSERERTLAKLAIAGRSNREIAVECGLTEQVVKNYMREIYDVCGVWTRTELAARYRYGG